MAVVQKNDQKALQWRNLGIGAAIQIFEVSTLGQPLEVLKTQMAAHRGDTLRAALRRTVNSEGGFTALWRGLVPWAWIEAGTKGGVLLFASGEIESLLRPKGNKPLVPEAVVGIVAGMGGGLAQAYTTMGPCTFMKTVEITRQRSGDARGTLAIALDVLRREGWMGMNRGVSAVALRQMTNWGSRMGIARITESLMRGSGDRKGPLSAPQRLFAAAVGGALGCWNQPLEVIRVEMQRQATRDPALKLSVVSAAKSIYGERGFAGFYRGVTPRIALSVYLTVCMVFGGDQLKRSLSPK